MSDPTKPKRPPRYPLRLAAELHHPSFRSGGTTRNVSSGGACVEVDRPVAEGSELDVVLFAVEDDIESESGSQLRLRATVQWSAESDRAYQVGLRWLGATPQQLAALERALGAVDPE